MKCDGGERVRVSRACPLQGRCGSKVPIPEEIDTNAFETIKLKFRIGIM